MTAVHGVLLMAVDGRAQEPKATFCPIARGGGRKRRSFSGGCIIMSTMEEIELEKRRKALDKDVRSLVDKYLSKMEWEIPDVDEPKARQLILDEIRQVVGRIENRS
jgi:hypothetical protein